MSILVIGRAGQVARALQRQAAAQGLALETLARPDLDLERPRDIEALVASRRPSVVINAAAYTAVDKAEDDAERAYRVNAEAAGAIAAAAASAGAPVIQISTDYVFAGDKTAPYTEQDAVDPTGVYGASKLEGERLALAANPRAVVVRTAWVYDATGANFVRTMLRLTKSRNEINVVADQRGCPTFATDLAAAILAIAQRPGPFGIYHCAGAGETTWASFAAEIFAQAARRGGPSARVNPITTADYPTRARRPENSRLDCAKLASDYAITMRDWRTALSACMDEIAAGGWSVE